MPPAHRARLVELSALEQAKAERLVQALAAAPQFGPVNAMIRAVRAALDTTSESAGRLVVTLLSVAVQVEPPEWPVERIIDEVARSPDLDIADSDRTRLADLLGRLVTLPALVSSAKASDVIIEHEHLFTSARVLTDIRPVFVGPATEQPTGAVIVHMLKIEHATGDEVNSFFVALDDEDLRTLGSVIERALAKSKSIGAVLDNGGLAHYRMEEN